MKKLNKIKNDADMLPEYDFAGKKGVRGKYYRDRQQGYTLRVHKEDGTVTTQTFAATITLESDVAKYFPDSQSVNKALRALIALVPNKQINEKKPKHKVTKKNVSKAAVTQ